MTQEKFSRKGGLEDFVVWDENIWREEAMCEDM
jgi:hypothetical protein